MVAVIQVVFQHFLHLIIPVINNLLNPIDQFFKCCVDMANRSILGCIISGQSALEHLPLFCFHVLRSQSQ